jgi:glutamate racemase
VPVVGVIQPGAESAVSVTRNRRIGIIGTQATVASGSYESAVRKIAPDCEVFSAACPLFVPLVEEGWIEGQIPEAVARRYLEPLIRRDIDTLILGCTHYPLLKPLISSICGENLVLVDSAAETAKTVSALLESESLSNSSETVRRSYYVSDLPRRFTALAERFLGIPLEQISIAEPWKSARPVPSIEGR